MEIGMKKILWLRKNYIRYAFKRLVEERFSPNFIITRVLQRLGISLPFVFKRYGLYLKMHPSATSLELYRGKRLIDADKFIIDTFVGPHSKCIDVGANIGHLSILMAKQAKEGFVIAIEPVPRIFSFMVENIEINKVENIIPINIAIDEKDGIKEFFYIKYSDDQSSFTINEEKFVLKDVRKINVIALRLDKLLELLNIKSVDFLKIDVEGAELLVLKSLGDYIKSVKYIWFEFIEKNYSKFGYTLEDIISFLNLNNFSLFKLNDNKQLTQVLSPNELTGYMGNLLAINNQF